MHVTSDKPSVACGVYLEDSPFQLAALRRHRPDAVVCRFVRPWNDPIEGCVDVTDFDDLLVVISELAALSDLARPADPPVRSSGGTTAHH